MIVNEGLRTISARRRKANRNDKFVICANRSNMNVGSAPVDAGPQPRAKFTKIRCLTLARG